MEHMKLYRRMWLLLLLLLLFLITPRTLLAQTTECPGVERWSVKTGTDPDAGLVNLNSFTRTTVENLRAIAKPSPTPPPNSRIAPTETKQWVITGMLMQYKLEDDKDYHLVIKGTSGNTMITEIPSATSPPCVGSGSPFLTRIQDARKEFDAKLHATTSFQTANVFVQITGVGMFDTLHGQTGVAPNGIELHPVLDITFLTTTQLLGNPGFESGKTFWASSSGVITNSTLKPAHTGSWKAWMDGIGMPHTDTLLQQVTIPAAASIATLTFWLRIDTDETTTTTAFDTMKVQIRNSSGTVLSTLATYSNLNQASGYQQKSFNLTSFAGQTIQIFFTASEDVSLQTSFVLDDVLVNVGQ
jgi:hypothetical protein